MSTAPDQTSGATGPEPGRSPRLGPVTDPDERQRELMLNGMERDGVPLNIFATLAHNPGILRRVNTLGGRFLQRGGIDPRLREIAILRSAYLSGSEYEFGQHRLIGRSCGLDDDEIAALARTDWSAPGGPDAWSDTERVVITMVDELSRDVVVSEGTWTALRAAFDDAQLVEVLLLPGFYRMLAGFLNSVGVQREAATPGWPDGTVPS